MDKYNQLLIEGFKKMLLSPEAVRLSRLRRRPSHPLKPRCAATSSTNLLVVSALVLTRFAEAAGAAITGEFAGQKKSPIAAPDGRWCVNLDPLPAMASPRELAISSLQESKIENSPTCSLTKSGSAPASPIRRKTWG